MARVACDLADILSATQAAVVAAGIVKPACCWLTLDDDDMAGTPPQAGPLASVSFQAFNERGDTQHVEMDWDDTPVLEGELIVTLWKKLQLDKKDQDTIILTHDMLGMSRLVRETVATFNNRDLTSGSDTLTWRSLNLAGFRNKGRWKAKEWRRLEVRFNCCFSYDPGGADAIRDSNELPIRDAGGGVIED